MRNSRIVEHATVSPVPDGLIEGNRRNLGIEEHSFRAQSLRFCFEPFHERPADTVPPIRGEHGHALGLGGAILEEPETSRPGGFPVRHRKEVGTGRIEAIFFLVARDPLLLDEDADTKIQTSLEALGVRDLHHDHGSKSRPEGSLSADASMALCENGRVNFLGHAVVALEQSEDERFVLGAMLPDFATMIGQRLGHVTEPALADGVALHHRTDAIFHAVPSFARLVTETTAALTAAGLRRGPARAVGHIGVEMLLDGWWVRHHGVPAQYDLALAAAPEMEAFIAWRGEAEPNALSRACLRLHELEIAPGYADPGLVTRRLERVLRDRPRLALNPTERSRVSQWAEATSATMSTSAPAIWTELRDGLRADAP